MKFLSLSSISFWLLISAAYIPFAVVTNFRIGFAYLSAEKLFLYLILWVVVYSYFANGVRKKGSEVFLLCVIVFVFYTASSLLFLNAGLSRTLRHAEFYLPFIAAVFLIVSSIKFEKEKFEFFVYWAIVLSAFSALIVHFFAFDWLQDKISQINEEVGYVMGAGRMYWDRSALALIAVFLFFNNSRLRKTKVATIGLVVVLIAVMATQSRSLFLACAFLLIIYLQLGFSAIFYVALIVFGVYSFFEFLPENAKNLFLTRFFFYDAVGELERSFDIGRIPLYENYLNLIKESPVFGAGLGFPLYYNSFSNAFIYTTDISLASFWVPFGLFGLALIFLFWRRIFYGIKEIRLEVSESYYRNLMYLFFASLLLSFNLDVFSRDIFVVVFVILIFKLKQN